MVETITEWNAADHLVDMEGSPAITAGGPYWRCRTCSRIFRKAQVDLREVYMEHRARCLLTVPLGCQQKGLADG